MKKLLYIALPMTAFLLSACGSSLGFGTQISKQQVTKLGDKRELMEDTDTEKKTAAPASLQQFSPEDFLNEKALQQASEGKFYSTSLAIGEPWEQVTDDYGHPDEELYLEGPAERYGNILLDTSEGQSAAGKLASIEWFSPKPSDIQPEDVMQAFGKPDAIVANEQTSGALYRYQFDDYHLDLNFLGDHTISEDGELKKVDPAAKLNSIRLDQNDQ